MADPAPNTSLEKDEATIKLRWMEVSDILGNSLVVDALYGIDDLKLKALSKLGIEPLEGEKPMQAWTRAMCEENGVEHTTPVCVEIREAIMWTPGAMKFMFWLA